MEYWERRGSAIYIEDDGTPGKATLVAELHPAKVEDVQKIVDKHNREVDSVLGAASLP